MCYIVTEHERWQYLHRQAMEAQIRNANEVLNDPYSSRDSRVVAISLRNDAQRSLEMNSGKKNGQKKQVKK